jgi:hypothetical protein
VTRRVLVPVVLVLALSLALGACGKGDPAVSRAEARKVTALDAPGVPGTLHGLKVKRENVKDALKSAKRPYLDSAALFSLRDGDQLMATLQIGHFAEDARWRDADFRSSLLSTMGGSAPRRLRMGDHSIYLSSGDRQSLAIWFSDRSLFILASREDYDFPRGLLRDALELKVAQ